MSKKNQMKKKSGKLTLVLGIVALVLALLTAGLLIAVRGMGEPSDTQPNQEMSPGETEVKIDPTGDETVILPGTQTDPASVQGTEGSGSHPEETKSNSGSDKDNTGKNPGNQNTSGKDNNSAGNTDKKPEETKPDTPENQPPVEIVERTDADYERWLAAAMVMGVSMEYPEFDLQGIYIASETTIEDKMESAGSYIIFTSGGETLAVHSVPLNGERSASGTRDISTETLGFATFDLVDADSVDTASMKEIRIEDMGELIAQSLLVSIYIH